MFWSYLITIIDQLMDKKISKCTLRGDTTSEVTNFHCVGQLKKLNEYNNNDTYLLKADGTWKIK